MNLNRFWLTSSQCQLLTSALPALETGPALHSLEPTVCEMPAKQARRVLLLTQDLNLAGAQRQLVELALGLHNCNFDVRVGVLAEGGPLTSELVAAGIPLVGFPRRWRWDLTPIARLRRYLKRERIEIVHSLLFLPNFYARLAGRLAGTPLVVSSLRSTGIEGRHRYLLDVLTSPICDVIIANSDAGRRDYIRHGGQDHRLVVVRNGLRDELGNHTAASACLRAEWGLSRFSAVVGMIASMEQRKDHRLLVRAMRRVLTEVPGAGLVLVGDGSLRPQVEAEAESQGIADRVVFAGWLREPRAAYELFDVYVQSSAAEEGTSNSIVEAMLSGRPVVATDIGGNREVVLNEVTGFVVPAGDEIAMSTTIRELLGDPAKRLSMGTAGAARARAEFTVDRLVAGTCAVYDRFLNERH